MNQNPIATLRDIVLSGTVTLPKGETVEEIVQHLNSFETDTSKAKKKRRND